jgi:RND family efflux transporter MFP subunit
MLLYSLSIYAKKNELITMKNPASALLTFCCLFGTLFLTGCGEEETAQEIEVVRPVKTLVVGGGDGGSTREFPGVVDATQKADISFRISGKLKSISIKEGDQVVEGQELAKLDQTDLKITLADRKASYDTAKANFDRAAKLVKKGHISKTDYDKLKANYAGAKAGLESAQQDIKYATLRASFAGYISKRYVENFEEVSAKQTIFSLQDVSSLDIKIDISENLMIRAKKNKNKRHLYATFNAIKDKQFPLTVKEISTQADEQTQTYQATLNMKPPENYRILPGMSATVVANMKGMEQTESNWVNLPVSAVISNLEKQGTVWLVDETNMTVSPRTVETGALTGRNVAVIGLNLGDRIVIAGAAFMREGMKVSLLETGEQAGH